MEVGTKTFFNGNEITIMSEPYELYGAMWQDGIDENGKVFTVKTTEQKQADKEKAQKNWKDQQDGFARLKALKNT